MAQTSNHSRNDSVPRLPFQTPVLHQAAYKEPTVMTVSKAMHRAEQSAVQRQPVPTLNIITGFDNPRTPPPAGYTFECIVSRGHKRKESIQDRRAKAKGEETRFVAKSAMKVDTSADLSPSDRMVVIGFDNAVKRLNIQTSIDHIISPITPSIIVTGVPKDDGSSEDMWLKPNMDKHRSSVYSRPTNAVHQLPFGPSPAASTPPVPVIPHDLLDPGNILSGNRSAVSHWSDDVEEEDDDYGDEAEDDDQSATYVGSHPPIKDDTDMVLLKRQDTVVTYRSDGWWNSITTPFLQRSATSNTRAARSPMTQPSPQLSIQPSPQMSLGSSPRLSPYPIPPGNKLTAANIAVLEAASAPSPPPVPTTPHIADHKRETIGFFGDATPKTAAFPEVPPIPQVFQEEPVLESAYHPTGTFGLAAEYYEAFCYEMETKEPYYVCVNHDCSFYEKKQIVSDERQRELFNEAIAKEHASASRGGMSGPRSKADSGLEHDHSGAKLAAGVAGGASAGAAIGLAAHGHDLEGSHASFRDGLETATTTPYVDSHVDPSDSVSQVAARSFQREASPQQQAERAASEAPRTMLSDSVASPEVVQARAMPMIRGVSPLPTTIPERSAGEAAPPGQTAPAAVPQSAPTAMPVEQSRSIAPVPAVPAPSAAAPKAAVPLPYPGSVAHVTMPNAAETARAPAPVASAGRVPSVQAPAPAFENSGEIGVARSMPPPPQHATAAANPFEDGARSVSPPSAQTAQAAQAAQPSRNPFLNAAAPPRLDTAVAQDRSASPAALTPGMSHEAEIGNAVPMQPFVAKSEPTKPPSQVASLTRRGVMENYQQLHSRPAHERTPSASVADMPSDSHRAAPTPPSAPPTGHNNFAFLAPVPVAGERDIKAPEVSEKDVEDSNEKTADTEKKPNKFGAAFALFKRMREKRKANRPTRTKEEKKRRRAFCGIFCCLLMMVILIVVLVLTLTLPRSDIPAQSSWLNLTDFPPLPTGVATIARPNAVKEQSGCISPATMWSCALPREDQDDVQPNQPDQPNFRIEIRFQNNSAITNGTVSEANGTQSRRLSRRNNINGLQQRDDFTTNLFTPNPAPPSDQDQMFLGNTTDHIDGPKFNGEPTPFFISFLPTSGNQHGISKRDSGSSSGSGGSSDDDDDSASSSSAVPSSTSSGTPTSTMSSAPSAQSTNGFSNLTNAIPSPAINPDGTVASATLYPLPSAQPLRLYNRGQADEHYGFYTYFDRSIFLSSLSLSSNGSWTYEGADVSGGSPMSAASLRCTWAQTRFLVKIWTRTDPSTAQLLNGSAVAEAAAAGNITQNSQSDWSQPGSFPYPVTITLDRHGGDARQKMVYCYDVLNSRVNDTTATVSLENRSYGGTWINTENDFLDEADLTGKDPAAFGGIDGGTGGCGCIWQNWQQVGRGSAASSGIPAS